MEDQEGDAVSGTTEDSVASDVVIDDLDRGSNSTEEADLTGGDESFDGDADVDDPAGSESGEPTLLVKTRHTRMRRWTLVCDLGWFRFR